MKKRVSATVDEKTEKNEKDIKERLERRVKSDHKRYQKYYGVDFLW